MNHQFVTDYKENEKLRNSFFELAYSVFGLQLKSWFEKGYWGSRYLPFSYTVDNQIIANVSVNVLNTVINGEKKSAIQIGTVMTHPDYRHQGLSAQLMNRVLQEYEDKCDFMYLFANETVLNYYPKFGFTPRNEYQFSMDYTSALQKPTSIRKLNGTNDKDLALVYQLAAERVPVSHSFGTEEAEDLLMFHCLNVFPQHIYYLPEEDIIAIFERQGQQLHVYDLISRKTINIETIINKLADEQTTDVRFYFTPDLKAGKLRQTLYTADDQLFVRAKDPFMLSSAFKHPITSQA